MNDINICRYLFLEPWAPLDEAFKSSPQYHVEELQGNPQDIITFLSSEKSALLFFSLGSKDDLVALANFVKMSKKELKDLPHKVIVVNFTGNKNIEKAIMKMGILDILEDGIKPRALRFKIDFWIKSLAHSLRSKPQKEVKRELKNTDSNQQEKRIDAPVWISPLDQEADIWIVRNQLEIKKILNRWLVKFSAPSPHVASWVEVEGQTGVWKFDVKPSQRELFLLTTGNWYFRGDSKPEFHWKEQQWTMAGAQMELFYQQDKNIFPRFYIKEKVLHIAKNSDYALTKQQLIQETLDQELIFKKDEVAAIDDLEIESKSTSLDPLKGKSSTDDLGSNSLSGKSKTGSDQLSDLNGRGKSDSIDGQMKGRSKNGESNLNEPLGHQVSGVSGHDPLKGKQEGEELSSIYKNDSKKSSPFVGSDEEDKRSQKQSESSKGPLQGKSSTDRVDSNYNSESQKQSSLVDKSADKKRKEFGDKESSDLSGKSKTDDLGSFYNNELKNDSTTNTDEKKRSSESANLKPVSEKNPKSSFQDDIETKKEGAAGRNKFESKELDLEVDGKEVQKYYKDHNEAPQYDGKDLSGKGAKADQLDGFMSSKREMNERDKKSSDDVENRNNLSKTNKDQDRKNPLIPISEKTLTTPAPNLDPFIDSTTQAKNNNGDLSKNESGSKNLTRASNIYPIKPQLQDNEDLESEGESIVQTEDSPQDISQTAKIYSFITQGAIKRICDLDDYFDDIVTIRVSGGDFIELEPVHIDMSFHYLKEKIPLKIDGVIEGIDADEKNYFFVTVRLKQNQLDQFEKFMAMFQKRQSHINQFIKMAKGI
ncbi:MAG: hypothetical protein ACOVP4_08565 [Bacteriovoracaceae bacterium]